MAKPIMELSPSFGTRLALEKFTAFLVMYSIIFNSIKISVSTCGLLSLRILDAGFFLAIIPDVLCSIIAATAVAGKPPAKQQPRI